MHIAHSERIEFGKGEGRIIRTVLETRIDSGKLRGKRQSHSEGVRY